MRKLFIVAIVCISGQGHAEVTASIIPAPVVSLANKNIENPGMIPAASHVKMKAKDFEKLSGQKLTLKEKLVFKIFQSKLKKEIRSGEKAKYSKRSKTAFILSLLSLATMLIIPLSIVLAVISIILASKSLKANSEDKKAKTAMALSLLALGIIVVGLLIYAIFVSDGAFKLFVIN